MKDIEKINYSSLEFMELSETFNSRYIAQGVLWKMENLPPIGKRSNIRVKMWVLNSQQAAYYARQGFNESVLDQAGEGNDPSQVSQAIETSVRNSKRGIFRGMLVSCFSVGVPRVCFDEIRLSQVSLDAAAGRIPTKN